MNIHHYHKRKHSQSKSLPSNEKKKKKTINHLCYKCLSLSGKIFTFKNKFLQELKFSYRTIIFPLGYVEFPTGIKEIPMGIKISKGFDQNSI